MKPFTFILLLLAQRVDDQLRMERLRSAPDPRRIERLLQRREQLNARLRRSIARPAWNGS